MPRNIYKTRYQDQSEKHVPRRARKNEEKRTCCADTIESPTMLKPPTVAALERGCVCAPTEEAAARMAHARVVRLLILALRERVLEEVDEEAAARMSRLGRDGEMGRERGERKKARSVRVKRERGERGESAKGIARNKDA